MSSPPKGGWKLKLHSHYYLIVWFKDGNDRKFYSLDWKSKYSRYDPSLGLARLRKLIAKYGALADGAIIYSVSTQQPFEEYFEGNILPDSNLHPHHL